MTPSPRYPIPKDLFRCEIEVERSRFITTVLPIDSQETAQEFIAAVKKEFPDANHNCWAYLVGQPGSSDQIGLSDDGEPHGAAGKPILIALQHSGLGDTAVVVTRYFGGVKLGKGGMVKAYTAAVKTALDRVPRTERVRWAYLKVAIEYSLVTLFERRMENFEIEIIENDYAERVLYRLRLPFDYVEKFHKAFDDLTSGKGSFSLLD